MYFNWVVFVGVVALALSFASFWAYEFSDLAYQLERLE